MDDDGTSEATVVSRRVANAKRAPTMAADIIPCPASSCPKIRKRRMPNPKPTPKRIPPRRMDIVAAIMARSKLGEFVAKSCGNAIRMKFCAWN